MGSQTTPYYSKATSTTKKIRNKAINNGNFQLVCVANTQLFFAPLSFIHFHWQVWALLFRNSKEIIRRSTYATAQ